MSTENPKSEPVSNDTQKRKAPPWIRAWKMRTGVLVFSLKDREGFYRTQSRSKYVPGVEDVKHRRVRDVKAFESMIQPGDVPEEPRKQIHE